MAPPIKLPNRTGRAPGRSRSGITSTPVVLSVSPSTDRIAGGTSVTITGQFFASGCTVLFGSAPATSVAFVSDTTITCNVPANASGTYDVTVTNPTGQSGTLSGGFTYYTSVITSISPPSGPSTGGTAVTLTGTNFVAGSTITIGGVAATAVNFVNSTTYTCTTPAGTVGPVDVVLTEPAAASTATLSGGYTFTSVSITPGVPAPIIDQPTTPNTTPPSNPITTTQGGIRRNPSITVKAALGNAPKTCTYTVDGTATPPVVNDDVSFTDNGVLKFAGTIQTVETTYEGGLPKNLVYIVTAADYTYQLNRFRPSGRYHNILLDGIVRDLVGRFAPGFSTAYIQPNLGPFPAGGGDPLPVSIKLDGSLTFSAALTQLAQMGKDCHWYVDFYKNVHFFSGTDPNTTSAIPLTDNEPTIMTDPAIVVTNDTTQLRNRVYVTGASSSAINNPLPPSSQSVGYIPITDPSYFVVAGMALVDGLPMKFTGSGSGIPTGNSAVVDLALTPYVAIDMTDAVTANNVYRVVEERQYTDSTGTHTYYAWPDGTSVKVYAVVEDLTSQGDYGIHEYFISDSNLLNCTDATNRGQSDVSTFSSPIIRIQYPSRDPLSVVGAQVSVNLTKPAVHGTFVIQEVTIDQFHDQSDTLAVRYNVTADNSARFNFTDFLLGLHDHGALIDSRAMNYTTITGLVTTSTQQAASVAGGYAYADITLTNAQILAGSTKPIIAVPAPGAGLMLVPITCVAHLNHPNPFGTAASGAFRYGTDSAGSGVGQNDLMTFSDWATNTTNLNRWCLGSLVNNVFIDKNIPSNGGGWPENKPLMLKASNDTTGGGNNTTMIRIYYAVQPTVG